MRQIQSPEVFQNEMEKIRRSGKTIGFVPTMGALHAGHLALVKAACRENDVVVVSIFVNPLQFGPREDFKKYPRPIRADRRLLEKAKTDFLFLPRAKEFYPRNFSGFVEPDAGLAGRLCGKFRPGHFRGVTTVVAKLFNTVRPHRVYFGAKDYQQAVIIRHMIADLNMGIDFRLRPTVREADGLAMSSRNRYLGADERRRARAIPQTLFRLRRGILADRRGLARLRQAALKNLRSRVDKIQYLEIVDPETLEPVSRVQRRMVALVACTVGKTRLIDNVIMTA